MQMKISDRSKGQGIAPGSLSTAQFDCLIELSDVRSDSVIAALSDYCVFGEKKATASSSRGIQPSAFSRAFRSICRVHSAVERYIYASKG